MPLSFLAPSLPTRLQRENLKCLQALHGLHLAQMQQHLDAAARLKEQVGHFGGIDAALQAGWGCTTATWRHAPGADCRLLAAASPVALTACA